MADILVTTPKRLSKLAAAEAKSVEDNPDAFWFRTLKGNVDVKEGDRVYYVDNGLIKGYGIVFAIRHGDMKCEGTGKVYSGTHLLQRKWVWLEEPVPFRGFQGFRYIDRILGLREKLE